MRFLTRPIMNLYCLTGDSMNIDVRKALEPWDVPEDILLEHNRRRQDALSLRMPKVKPVDCDLRWWFTEQWHDGKLDATLNSLSDEDRNIVLRTGIKNKFSPYLEYIPVENVELIEKWTGEPVKYVNGGYPGTHHHVTLHTPVGTLTACEAYAERSFGIVEYPVKEVEDLKIVRYVYEQRAKTALVERAVGCAPMLPMQIMLVHLAGVENTAYMMADDPEEVIDFLRFLDDIFNQAYDAFTRRGRLAISIENFDSAVSGGYFDEFLAPSMRARFEIAQRNGGRLGVHHDGKLLPMVGKLAENGIRYINGLTAGPSGDLDIIEMRRVIGDGVVLCDMVPQAIFMDEYPEKDFEEFIVRAASYYRDDPGIIFGIGDMLPATGDIRRFIKMVHIIEEITRRS